MSLPPSPAPIATGWSDSCRAGFAPARKTAPSHGAPTDESYIEKQSGTRIDKTEWHRVVSFQSGLIDMLEKHAKKGRLVYVAGKLQTRKWRKDGEDSDRFSTEILLVPGGRVQFLDRPAGTNGNGAQLPDGEAAPAADADPVDSTIPF